MGGRIYGPYTGRHYRTFRDTDVEHIVAVSEAHDSGLCAAGPTVRRRFASDLLILTLAAPEVNRCGTGGKCAFDPAEWLPPVNRCWFVARVVAVKFKYRLTVDRREAAALERVLSVCTTTSMIVTRPGGPTATPRTATAAASDGAGTIANRRAVGPVAHGVLHPELARVLPGSAGLHDVPSAGAVSSSFTGRPRSLAAARTRNMYGTTQQNSDPPPSCRAIQPSCRPRPFIRCIPVRQGPSMAANRSRARTARLPVCGQGPGLPLRDPGIAHRHAPRIERQDAVVKALESTLAPWHDQRLESAVAVLLNLQLNAAVLGQYRLARMAIATVVRALTSRIALLLARVIAQISAQRPLQSRLLQVTWKARHHPEGLPDFERGASSGFVNY